jgi:hypothetical protein
MERVTSWALFQETLARQSRAVIAITIHKYMVVEDSRKSFHRGNDWVPDRQEGPKRTKGYQSCAKKNLSIVEGDLSKPETARLPDCAGRSNHAASSQSLAEDAPTGDDEDSACCAACQRRPNLGEKKLLRCANCQKAKYCNSLCQKGH